MSAWNSPGTHAVAVVFKKQRLWECGRHAGPRRTSGGIPARRRLSMPDAQELELPAQTSKRGGKLVADTRLRVRVKTHCCTRLRALQQESPRLLQEKGAAKLVGIHH